MSNSPLSLPHEEFKELKITGKRDEETISKAEKDHKNRDTSHENHIKAKLEHQKEEESQLIREETQRETQKDKQEIQESFQKWESDREDRLKRFLEKREPSSEENPQKSLGRRIRAKTVASSSVSAYFDATQEAQSQAPAPAPAPRQPKGQTAGKRSKQVVVVNPERPVPSVPLPKSEPLTVEQLFPNNSEKPDVNLLKQHFFQEGKLTKQAALALLQKVEPILRREPNLLELEASICVFGDIHGQFYDLLHLLEAGGDPSTTQYLFLGDYVDRGDYGCEVCFLLFAYKINYPYSFFMLRGNHESRLLTSHFNFKRECFYKYGFEIYNMMTLVFDCLPLAALITNNQGTFFCTHGGLSPDIVQLEDIDDIDRFMDPPEKGPLCDLLWSDPLEESTAANLSEEELNDWYEVDFVPNPTRGCGYVFGLAAVAPFLAHNNLTCLIRAHEVQKEGFLCNYFCRRDAMEQDALPLVITVFSAPNYCGVYGNLAAFLRFQADDFACHQVGWAENVPYRLPDFLNGITYSLPCALEAFTKFSAYILEGLLLVPDEEEADDQAMKKKVDSFGKLSILMEKMRERSDRLVTTPAELEGPNKFELAHKIDYLNEKRPARGKRRRTKSV
eukprot:TRINITY_DN12706_c0_g1_i1.p1 TRINITY_DN12706_c0_g1~~TRINITY_DN12706_c0_g1_i1.p1  ORF type:complete len:618 (+),score=123.85 TRINITY_DN12706_c0_g1_i1:52-1905(+)